MIAGDVFDGVGFVEDDGVVLGEVVDAGGAEGEIGEEEGVVDDEDSAGLHAAPGGLPVAGLVELASLAQAVAMLSADFVPDVAFGDVGYGGEGAVGGGFGPLLDDLE